VCDPVSLTIAATAVATVGKVVSSVGQSQQATYAAQVDQVNRNAAIDQGNQQQQNTDLAAQRRYRDLAQTKGQQQAAMAANGVDINFGSALDVQQDTSARGAEDAAQIYRAGNDKLKSIDNTAWNYGADAAAQRSKASGALVDGAFGAISTALGGASQTSKMKAGLQNTSGGFG